MKRTLLFLFGILALTFSGFAQNITKVTVDAPENLNALNSVKELTLSISTQPALNSGYWSYVGFSTSYFPYVTNGTSTVTGTFERGTYPQLILKLDEEVTEEGTYTLVIPNQAIGMPEFGSWYFGMNVENCFTIVGGGGGEEPSTPTVFVEYSYSVTNGEGNTFYSYEDGVHQLSSIQSVNITVPRNLADPWVWNENLLSQIVLSKGDNQFVPVAGSQQSFGTTYKVTFDTVIDEEGVYTLYLPQGLVSNSAGESEATELLDFATVVAPAPEVNYFEGAEFIEPVPGVVTSLGDFRVYLPNKDGKNANVNASLITISNGETTVNPYMGFDYSEGFVFYVDEISAPGMYTVTVPAGAVTVDGKANTEDIVAEYTIEAPVTVPTVEVTWSYAVTNSEGDSFYSYDEGIHELSSIKSVNITVPTNYTDPWVWNENLLSQIVLSNGNVEVSPVSGAQLSFGRTYKVTFEDAIDAEGVYTLYLPQGLVSNSTGESAATEFVEFATVIGSETPAPEVNYFEDAEFIEPKPGVVTSLGDTYKVALPKRDGKNCDVKATEITVSANGEVVANGSVGFISSGDLVFYTTNSDLTAPGEYIVTIPAGALTIEGTTNTEAITAVYTIEAPKPDYWANVSMTPAPGVVESLPSGDLLGSMSGGSAPTFGLYIPSTGGNEVIAVEDWSAISFTTTANEDVNLTSVMYMANSEEDGYLYILTDKFYTAAGEYTLTIPAGVFSIDDVLNPELVFNYTIQEQTKPELDLSYTVTPEDGAEVELPVTVTFTYSDEVALWQLVESAEDVVALYDESGNKVGDYELGGLFEEPANEFYVNITSTDLTAGEYTLVVPAGVIEFNDANYDEVYGVNPEMTVKYVVKGEGTPEFNFDYVVTPEAGSTLDQTTTVVVKYSDALMVWSVNGVASEAYLLNEEGEKVATYDLYYFYENNISSVYANVNLGTLFTGKYTFHIPAGTIELDNAENPDEVLAYNEDINVEYNIVNVENGVEAVFGDAVEFTVYDLNGNVLVKNGDKSALENLANGVYVINGKKVILRR